uniref:Cyclin N-terminal domain-containing protein n=1 Tax=Chromera velia CCMP2878 TaxID=1169474 RepID=A0A0G4I2W1_9ALVE|eukprot:Cvel_10510.t1-p1 / transcript=Cvel_10510.t1 / gene=Cvel_10510 / organism=Chromera_velia_CCMP2878 / gene_product=hypothetical protein / transcript_product=hypothetical protein / location=Cvel_scaffold635:69390-73753(+) / protein_length=474 / sequence_SO=supercontig / SO=protein_coding / is_pseudo=false
MSASGDEPLADVEEQKAAAAEAVVSVARECGMELPNAATAAWLLQEAFDSYEQSQDPSLWDDCPFPKCPHMQIAALFLAGKIGEDEVRVRDLWNCLDFLSQPLVRKEEEESPPSGREDEDGGRDREKGGGKTKRKRAELPTGELDSEEVTGVSVSRRRQKTEEAKDDNDDEEKGRKEGGDEDETSDMMIDEGHIPVGTDMGRPSEKNSRKEGETAGCDEGALSNYSDGEGKEGRRNVSDWIPPDIEEYWKARDGVVKAEQRLLRLLGFDLRNKGRRVCALINSFMPFAVRSCTSSADPPRAPTSSSSSSSHCSAATAIPRLSAPQAASVRDGGEQLINDIRRATSVALLIFLEAVVRGVVMRCEKADVLSVACALLGSRLSCRHPPNKKLLSGGGRHIPRHSPTQAPGRLQGDGGALTSHPLPLETIALNFLGVSETDGIRADRMRESLKDVLSDLTEAIKGNKAQTLLQTVGP